MAHDPATLASPDLLSEVSDMKQDLIRMSTILTTDLSEQSLVADGDEKIETGIANAEAEEPFEIVEKVKEDLEKVGEILRVGAFGEAESKETVTKSKSGDEDRVLQVFEETKSKEIVRVQEPLLTEVRITKATDSSSPPRKDASEMVSHLTTDLETYLQEIPVGAHHVQEGEIVEETFTEVVLPRERRRHPPKIKKPARRKLKEREFASGSSEDELERMSSEESLDGDTVLGDPEVVPGPAPVSPKVVETPIGSIKDRVKALQKKVEEEEKEECLKKQVRQESKQMSTVQSRIMDDSCTVLPKSPKSPRSQTERIEETMSVRELMKAFQTGQDPSKNKSGLFEHKAITDLAVTSTATASQESQDSQILETQQSKQKTGESSHDVLGQYQQTVISDEIVHGQSVITSEDRGTSQNIIQTIVVTSDVSPSDQEDYRLKRMHTPEKIVIQIGESYQGPDEQVENSDSQLSKDSEWSKKVEESTIALEMLTNEEAQRSPERLTYQTIRHERRISEEPQISPDRRPSEDFSAVIKEELEDSPEYQLFKQAAGSAQLRFSRESRNIQDRKSLEHATLEYHSYKPNSVVRFAEAMVHSVPFSPSAIHDEIGESLEKDNDKVGDSPCRTPRTSLGESETYEEQFQSPQASPKEQILPVKEATSSIERDFEKEEIQMGIVKELSPEEIQTGAMKDLSLTGVQEQVQTEIKGMHLQETAEEDQDGYEGILKELSPTEIQTGVIEEFSPTEVQEQVQTDLKRIHLQDAEKDDQYGFKHATKEMDPEGLRLQDTKDEDQNGYKGMAKELSPAEIQTGVMKDLSHTEVQEQAQTEHGMVFEFTKRGSFVEDMDYSHEVPEFEKNVQIKGTDEALKVMGETAESGDFEKMQFYCEIPPTRPDHLATVQPVMMNDPRSVYQGDSLETTPVREGFSSHKSPDSIEPSPVKEFPCPDSLETSPTEQRAGPQTAEQLFESSKDSPKISDFMENIEIEKNDKMIIQREAEASQHFDSPDSQCLSMPLKPCSASLDGVDQEEDLRSSGQVEEQFTAEVVDEMTKDGTVRKEMIDSTSSAKVEEFVTDSTFSEASENVSFPKKSFCSETADAHDFSVPITTYSSQPEADDDLDFASTVKKQFTPEEEMFKMAAKIRVFDEIEKEAKMRKEKFDFSSSLQDRADETAKDTKQEGSLESNQVLSSYLESEQYYGPELTKLPQEITGQAISDSQASEDTEHGVLEDETPLKESSMQIHIDKKKDCHDEFSSECLTKPVDQTVTTDSMDGKLSAASGDYKIDSDADILSPVMDEKTSGASDEAIPEKPQSLSETVCPITDAGEPLEEQKPDLGVYEEENGEESHKPVQGDLVPWSVELEDDESFDSRIEAEERKVFALVADSRSSGTTPETTPGRTPAEDGTPNPFLFQEGKLFEMTRGGAIDMSKRSMEEEQDAFVFFPLREEPAEEAPTEQAEESGTTFCAHDSSIATLLDSTRPASQDDKCSEESAITSSSPSKVSGEDIHESSYSDHYLNQIDSESSRDKDLDSVDSSIANIDTATSTVTRSVYSEQDLESSDSSTEEEQHSVIEIPTPTQETISVNEPPGIDETRQSPASPKEFVAETEGKKPKSKIPVKAASFDQMLGKGDSTEQSQRPKSEADMGLSEWVTASIDCSSAKPKLPASKLPVPVEQTLSGAPQPSQTTKPSDIDLQKPEGRGKQEPTDEKEHVVGSLDSEGHSRPLPAVRPYSVAEEVFETRPNWEDCVETQIQRISDSSSPDQSKVDWHDDADRKEETLAIIADLLGFSWTELAKELEFSEDEVQQVRSENPNSLQEQSNALLQRWAEREGKHATEDCLIKRLTKINRMDIVHLIETQMNKSVQEQTSRTYAEIERTLDHSEALSSVQEDVDSPRLVRRVDVSSQRHPPAVSEEDLSVASLLDIPSWAETMGHPHSESIHGDMLEELDITQDSFTNAWAAQEVRIECAGKSEHDEQLSSTSQEENQTHCDPLGHVDTCLSPSPTFLTKCLEQQPLVVSRENFFKFSQVSIDRFSEEISAEEPSNERVHASQDHGPESLEDSPLEDLSPVCEKSDIEGNEKSLSELIQSPLSESTETSDILQSFSKDNEQSSGVQVPESEQASGRDCISPLPVQILFDGSPVDWVSSTQPDQQDQGVSQATPELIKTPIELDYVFVESDQISDGPMQFRDFDPTAVSEMHKYAIEKQDFSAKLDEVSQTMETEKETVNPDESVIIPSVSELQEDKYPAKSSASSMESPELIHQSEEPCDDHDSDDFFAQEQEALQMQDGQRTPSGYADDGKMSCEAQFENGTIQDSWNKTTLHREVSPSASDVSPQTPETVRSTQHFEFGDILSEPVSTEPNFVKEEFSVLTKDVGAARIPTKDSLASKAKDSKRSLSQSFAPVSQYSETASLARSFSEAEQTTETFTTDQYFPLPQSSASIEHPLPGQLVISEPVASNDFGNENDNSLIKPLADKSHSTIEPEIMEVPDVPAEDSTSIKICESFKASDGKPRVLPRVLQRPEDSDSETFFECKQTVSDYSEPELDGGYDAANSCFGKPKPELQTQWPSSSSNLKKVFWGSIQCLGSEDYEDAPIIQEPSEKSQEEDEEDLAHTRQNMSQPFIRTPQELHTQGGAMDDDDDSDDIWRDVEEELGVLSESSDEDVLSTRVVRRRVIIQGDEVPDIPLQPVTEEQYIDEQGNLVIKKVSRRVIKRCVSADGVEREEVRVEGHPAGPIAVGQTDSCSKVVKRTVVKSEGDQTEVTFCERNTAAGNVEENGGGREVTQTVRTTVVKGERMEKHLGDPHLATDLPTAQDDFTQGEDEQY
ncbi:hypothetical protein MHYP_G00251480 [Metynnis hypsauchen]